MSRRKQSRSDTAARRLAGSSPPGERTVRWLWLLPIPLLAATTVVSYSNAGGSYYLFDSQQLLLYRTVWDLEYSKDALWEDWLSPGSSLTLFTFALNYDHNVKNGLPGMDRREFLTGNILIHVLNVCLLYILIRALFRLFDPQRAPPIWIPLAIALLFAVHPLRVSSVAYIMQRRGMLAAMFYMLGILAFLRLRTTPRLWVGVASGLGVVGCYWLSFKSQTMGLTLPFALLAVEFCIRAHDRAALKRYLAWLVPGLLLSTGILLYFLHTMNLFDFERFEIRPWVGAVSWGVWEHFLTESRVFVHWWKLNLLPLPAWLCVDHEFQVSWRLTEHWAWLAVLSHALLLAAAVWAAVKRYKMAAFGIFLFYIALIPWILLPQTELFVEYKTYLSSIGFSLLLAEVLYRLRDRVSLRLQVAGVVVVAVVLLLLTIGRTRVYADPMRLWTEVIEKTPQNARAYMTVGNLLSDQGQYAKAEPYYRKGVSLSPNYAIAHYNLGNLLSKLDRPRDAVESYEEAVRLGPRALQPRIMLGNAYATLGMHDEAIEAFLAALALESKPNEEPIRAKASFNLGNSYTSRRQVPEARAAYHRALEISSTYYNAYDGLARLALGESRVAEAIEFYRKAIKGDPRLHWAHQGLGRALLRNKQPVKAVDAYRSAVRLRGSDPEIWYGLGVAYLRSDQFDDAVKALERTIRLKPDHQLAQQSLTAARQRRRQ